MELPGILSPAQLSGTEPLPEPLPLAGELERVFAARISQLEPGLRTLALLCACSGRLPAITAAAAALGVDAAGLAPPGRAGQHRGSGRDVRASADSLRSLLPGGPRRASGRARCPRRLCEADRRAWHLARAASGPIREPRPHSTRRAALRRSGYGAAADALERAAELSPATAVPAAGRRGGRRMARRGSARVGRCSTRPNGSGHGGRGLAADAPSAGLIELRSGLPADGLALLLPAAAEAVGRSRLAVGMLAAAGECAFQAGD